jgi:type VI secretion system protein ImpF
VKVAEAPIILTVLDRLLGEDLDDRGFRLRGREHSVARHRAAVARDLEWLLNTRRTPDEAPEDFPETRESVYHYGIPDLQHMGGESGVVRRALAREIKDAVQTFEPRLSQVRVAWVSQDEEGEEGSDKHRLRFRIDAILLMDPEPERVSFDAILDKVQGDITVQRSGDAG